MSQSSAYIIAARRTALGRVGGLHRHRRVEDLAAPVVGQVLDDAGLTSSDVEELIIGNASQGGNPARLIALASGLPLSTSALTLDRQCASGLDAILTGAAAVERGDATVVVAGGAESLSTAPWRIAKPR
ncbi:MAG: acetyl-CoA C-acyltransferase, partial [Pseudomonadota bacterium]